MAGQEVECLVNYTRKELTEKLSINFAAIVFHAHTRLAHNGNQHPDAARPKIVVKANKIHYIATQHHISLHLAIVSWQEPLETEIENLVVNVDSANLDILVADDHEQNPAHAHGNQGNLQVFIVAFKELFVVSATLFHIAYTFLIVCLSYAHPD